MRRFNNKDRQHRPSGAEKRLKGLRKRLKGLNFSGSLDKKQEIEVAHILNEIDRYGFEFFPNHYLFNKIDQIEQVLDNKQ